MTSFFGNADGNLQEYLREISTNRVLTREEEVALFQKLETGDESAREELLSCNLRLVVKIALQFKNSGLSLADLIQEGNIGLLTVLDKFDWRRGFRFSTYAAYWIRQEMQNALRGNNSLIRLPVRKARLMGKINEIYKTFASQEGRDPEFHEIMEFSGIDETLLKTLLPLRDSVLSLDADSQEEGGRCMVESIPSESKPFVETVTDIERKDSIHEALNILTERERNVLSLRFGLRDGNALSLRKTSKLVGLSQEGVRRVEQRAISKLRKPTIMVELQDLMSA